MGAFVNSSRLFSQNNNDFYGQLSQSTLYENGVYWYHASDYWIGFSGNSQNIYLDDQTTYKGCDTLDTSTDNSRLEECMAWLSRG